MFHVFLMSTSLVTSLLLTRRAPEAHGSASPQENHLALVLAQSRGDRVLGPGRAGKGVEVLSLPRMGVFSRG